MVFFLSIIVILSCVRCWCLCGFSVLLLVGFIWWGVVLRVGSFWLLSCLIILGFMSLVRVLYFVIFEGCFGGL